MTRLLLPFAALVALAACDPLPALAPEAVSDAYEAALLGGDIDGALGLLEAQAETGDLNALATLADIHSRGYVTTPWSARQKVPANVAIWTWPWDGPLAARRFERTLQDSVETGSHNALFFLADRHLAKRFTDGEWSTPDAEGAQALYDRLASEDADPLRLAFLAQRLGDDEAYQAHLRASADTGQKTACLLHYYQTRDGASFSPAATLADQIDQIAACLDRAAVPQPEETLEMGQSALRSLVEQRALGNEAAAATLDSLRTLGLFERHPRLESYVAQAG